MLSFMFIKRTMLLVIFLCLPNIVTSKTIDIKSTHGYTENKTYFVDAELDFKLTDEANEALLHGVPLEIHTHFQLRHKRKWLWDKTVNEEVIIFKLEHLPLTNNYLTINIHTGLRNSYSNLDAALNHINTITKLKLFDYDLLSKEKNYIARVKTFLDISSLPTPLLPQAYFSSEWDMSSKWLEWDIMQ
jgi:hypothetical protein